MILKCNNLKRKENELITCHTVCNEETVQKSMKKYHQILCDKCFENYEKITFE